jgi:hypothetical protein
MKFLTRALLLLATAASASASDAAAATSAALTALRLPELVTLILTHLGPAEYYAPSGDCGASAPDFVHAADGAATPDALSSAIRVNGTWFVAGVPLLWRFPSEHALHRYAFDDARRRALYTPHIRLLHLSGQHAMSRALTARAVSLPRLSVVHMAYTWGREHWHQRHWDANILRHQPALMPCIGSDLAQLASHVSDVLIDRLLELHGDTAAAAAKAEGMPPSLPVSEGASPPVVTDTAAKSEPLQISQQSPDFGQMELRALTLYGLHNPGHETSMATATRLLAWLAQWPMPAPRLVSVRLAGIFDTAATTPLADHAFRHFALRPRLTRLALENAAVSQNAMEDVLAWTTTDPRRCGAAYTYRAARFQLVAQPECDPRRPFAYLTHLDLTLGAAAAVAPLALLLASVTCLRLTVRGGAGLDASSDDAGVRL